MLSQKEKQYYENIIKAIKESRKDLNEVMNKLDLIEKLEAELQDLEWDIENIINNYEDYDNYNEGDIFDKVEETLNEYYDRVEELESLERNVDEYKDFIENKIYKLIENKIKEIKEIIKDNEEYEKDPLGYYGLSIHDFI